MGSNSLMIFDLLQNAGYLLHSFNGVTFGELDAPTEKQQNVLAIHSTMQKSSCIP
jgi:hypothetical protein